MKVTGLTNISENGEMPLYHELKILITKISFLLSLYEEYLSD
jgi:hypothetical protein